jgi:hypothetical protein
MQGHRGDLLGFARPLDGMAIAGGFAHGVPIGMTGKDDAHE